MTSPFAIGQGKLSALCEKGGHTELQVRHKALDTVFATQQYWDVCSQDHDNIIGCWRTKKIIQLEKDHTK